MHRFTPALCCGREPTYGFRALAHDSSVELEFGLRLCACMFPPGSMEALGDRAADIGPRCSPVLDLQPDGMFGSCFPLCGLHQETLRDQDTAGDLRSRFDARLAGPRRLGIFRNALPASYARAISALEVALQRQCNDYVPQLGNPGLGRDNRSNGILPSHIALRVKWTPVCRLPGV